MNAIGLKNFRNFQELPMLQTNGVTILVGGNNAGKSTITMAYRLLAQNIYDIIKYGPTDFDRDDFVPTFRKLDFSSICGNFERALSRYGENDIITFNFKLGYFDFSLQVGAIDAKEKDSIYGKLVSIVIKDIIDDCSWEWNLKNFSPSFRYSGQTIAQILKCKELVIDLAKYNKDEETNNKISSILSTTQYNIKNYENNKKVFEYKSGNDVPFDFQNEKIIFDGKHTEIVPITNDDYEITLSLSCEPQGDYKWFSDFFKKVRKDLLAVCNPNQMKYFPAIEAPSDSYFKIKVGNADDSTGVICDFFRINSRKLKSWVRNMMRKLDIGDNFDIIQANADFLYVTITNKQGTKIPLADNGRGAVQLFILLLRMAIYSNIPRDMEQEFDDDYKKIDIYTLDQSFPNGTFRERSKTKLLIVEEPEQNLHPRLQSKLADIFKSLHQEFGVNVLVETHSEYLVRRSQVIVAEANYKDEKELTKKCPFKVYYIPEAGKGQPYDMEYQISGRFLKSFGEGFYDESAKWTSVISANERKNVQMQEFLWETK